jgi:hypothetical protein
MKQRSDGRSLIHPVAFKFLIRIFDRSVTNSDFVQNVG